MTPAPASDQEPAMKNRFRATVAGMVVLVCAVLAADSIPPVKSQALSDAIRIDGNITDWSTLIALTKDVSVAAANDNDRLYLAIASSSPEVKQRLLAAGLTVYLDPQGKKKEAFGVRLPPLGGAAGRGRAGGGPGGRPGGDPTNPPPPPPGAGSDRGSAVTYVEVIGPVEKERHIVDLARPMGFAVASGDNAGTLLIELAMPLRVAADIPYAPTLIAGKSVIGIGFVTSDPPRTGGAPSGGPGGGGRGGMPGGRGGGMGGGRGGGMPGGGPDGRGGDAQGKAFKIWTTLALATPQ